MSYTRNARVAHQSDTSTTLVFSNGLECVIPEYIEGLRIDQDIRLTVGPVESEANAQLSSTIDPKRILNELLRRA